MTSRASPTRARRLASRLASAFLSLALASASVPSHAADTTGGADLQSPEYVIGTGDLLQVFVWKNPDLSAEVRVRPDGRITTPLAQDLQAQGMRPTELAARVREALGAYIHEPVVTVVVKETAGAGNVAAVRVIGAAATPKAVPYRSGLTVLDVVIDVGGLTVFANGNGAKLLRREKDGYRAYPLRLKDLVRSGDLSANVNLLPGDVITIPERFF